MCTHGEVHHFHISVVFSSLCLGSKGFKKGQCCVQEGAKEACRQPTVC